MSLISSRARSSRSRFSTESCGADWSAATSSAGAAAERPARKPALGSPGSTCGTGSARTAALGSSRDTVGLTAGGGPQLGSGAPATVGL
jgi:hypothetical protein